MRCRLGSSEASRSQAASILRNTRARLSSSEVRVTPMVP